MNATFVLKKCLPLTAVFAFMTLVYAPMSLAAPAAPGVFSVVQPDGTRINAIARGDERIDWLETDAGYTIAKSADGNWYYATASSSGIVANGPSASPINGVDPGLPLTSLRADQPPPANLPKHIIPSKAPSLMMAPMIRDAKAFPAPPVGAHSGKLLILMVDFSNRAGTYTPANFKSFFTSVAAYYNTVSNGNVTLTPAAETNGTINDGVVGWLRLPYAHPNCGGTCDNTIVQDAITAAAPFVNFAAYDANADGVITGDELAVIVFAAGYENAYGGAASPTPRVWGHADWGNTLIIPGSATIVDGYTLMGEIHGDGFSNHQATMGIVVHELGHLMYQWPDLYDIDYSSQGIGGWCLMSGGTWGGKQNEYRGQTPVMPSAWLRKKSGWVSVMSANGAISVTSAGAGFGVATANNTVVQALTNGPATQYFLIENRQSQGYDQGLWQLVPSTSFTGGLAIWHIDESVSCATNTCNANDQHRMVNLEAADGWNALNGTYPASNTNLWFSGNGVSFNSTSSPNSNLYGGAASGVSVSGVSASATVMTATTGSAKYTVSATVGTGGSVTPASHSVSGGSTASFTVTGNIGYATPPSVGGTCVAGTFGTWTNGSATYTTGAVSAACSVSFTFSQLPPSLPTATTGAVGGISSAGGAVLNALVNPHWGATVVSFEFGVDTTYGTIITGGTVTSWATHIVSSTALTGLTCGVTYHYRVTATNVSGTTTGADATFVACKSKTYSDLDGDGLTDILWRNAGTGATGIWFMNGVVKSSGGATSVSAGAYTPTTGWHVQGVGDFDSDGRADILWRSAATGATGIWFMNGTTKTGGGLTSASAGKYTATTGLQVQGVGDFNGDGFADILWRNAATGVTSIWLMNGTTQTGGGPTSAYAGGYTATWGWQIQGVGDFDGDGKADILWRNAQTGATAIWLMNGPAQTAGGATSASAGKYTATTGWQIQGVGDFNGDGQADILWRNALTGKTLVWFMNGTALVGGGLTSASAGTYTATTGWQVQGVGDFNGDGMADILWRNAGTGKTNVWFMNGITQAGGGLTNVSAGPYTATTGWHIMRKP